MQLDKPRFGGKQRIERLAVDSTARDNPVRHQRHPPHRLADFCRLRGDAQIAAHRVLKKVRRRHVRLAHRRKLLRRACAELLPVQSLDGASRCHRRARAARHDSGEGKVDQELLQGGWGHARQITRAREPVRFTCEPQLADPRGRQDEEPESTSVKRGASRQTRQCFLQTLVTARTRQAVGTRLDGRDIQDRRGRLACRTPRRCVNGRHDEEDQEPAGHHDWLDTAGEGLVGTTRHTPVCAFNPLGLS